MNDPSFFAAAAAGGSSSLSTSNTVTTTTNIPGYIAVAEHEAAIRFCKQQYATMQAEYENEIARLEKVVQRLQTKHKMLVEQVKNNNKHSLNLPSSKMISKKRKAGIEEEETKNDNQGVTGRECPEASQAEQQSPPMSRRGRPKKQSTLPEIKGAHAAKWNLRYAELESFKQRFGHVHVSRTGPHAVEYKELGLWCSTQRAQYKALTQGETSYLTPERVRALHQLGFAWSVGPSPSDWNTRFQQLIQFKRDHGHTRVPQKWVPPSVSNHGNSNSSNNQSNNNSMAGLGGWVLEQRKAYKENPHPPLNTKRSLTRERIAQLESIGFEWSLRNRTCQRKSDTNKNNNKNNNARDDRHKKNTKRRRQEQQQQRHDDDDDDDDDDDTGNKNYHHRNAFELEQHSRHSYPHEDPQPENSEDENDEEDNDEEEEDDYDHHILQPQQHHPHAYHQHHHHHHPYSPHHPHHQPPPPHL